MSSTRRSVSAALLALSLTAAVSACSSDAQEPAPSTTVEDGGATTPAPTSSEPTETVTETATATDEATESAEPAPTEEPPADELALPEDAEGFTVDVQSSDPWPDSSGNTYLTQVRAAAHDGFDRVVFEYRDSRAPSYYVSYVDEASAEGSGDPIDIEGSAFLRVEASRVLHPTDLDDDPALLLTGSSSVGDADLRGIHSEGPWEGHAGNHIGLDRVREYRVTTLDDPGRIVVDIKR